MSSKLGQFLEGIPPQPEPERQRVRPTTTEALFQLGDSPISEQIQKRRQQIELGLPELPAGVFWEVEEEDDPETGTIYETEFRPVGEDGKLAAEPERYIAIRVYGYEGGAAPPSSWRPQGKGHPMWAVLTPTDYLMGDTERPKSMTREEWRRTIGKPPLEKRGMMGQPSFDYKYIPRRGGTEVLAPPSGGELVGMGGD